MGVAKAVGDFMRIEKCLPLEESESSKITANLVNEFTEQSLQIMKESIVNQKRGEANQEKIKLHIVTRCGKQIS